MVGGGEEIYWTKNILVFSTAAIWCTSHSRTYSVSYITLEQKECKVSVLAFNYKKMKVKVKVKSTLEQATKAQGWVEV
jgi:hypothetical protein